QLPTSPHPAAGAHARANALYGAQKFAEAAVEYGRATAACPEAANWWVDLTDSFYEMDDYERAKTNFTKALSVDRWNREAHRFFADTYVQLGDNEAALR